MSRWLAASLVIGTAVMVFAAATVPPAIEQPGTQPTEVGAFDSNCANCHANTDNPAVEPFRGWQGSMMAHAMRDGLFWATVAVAEQTFLPGADPAERGGAGDLCLRCHGPRGWLGGRSEPTDGSMFATGDADGVECEFCHLMVDPDQPVNVQGTVEVQNPPFEAYDPSTGEGYHGSGQYVINGNGTRLGPYADATANHGFLASTFFREGEFCGTCHDVSNPAVGDLAHNFGAQLPLDPDTYSGVLDGPLEDKAQFNNPPYAYGVVERTFSEWKASGLDSFVVNDFASLPADLQVAGGALDVAYHRAWDARSDADYVDGAVRTFTCQTCHLAAATGKGCNKASAPVRDDLARHDMTGGSYWMPDLLTYQEANGTLLFGAGLDSNQLTALQEGKARAAAQLASAAQLSASQQALELLVRTTNLTGHKLISGYPEGRRMWLNLQWRDSGGALIQEDGGYGAIGRSVTDLDGNVHQVQSLIDPAGAVIYEVHAGLDQAWAQQLIDLEYPADLPLDYDRLSSAVTHTLGELAASPPDTALHSFHFVLNNVVISDNRIPPYGFDRDHAEIRNVLPVPSSAYGDPLPGEAYDYWDEQHFAIPAGAAEVSVRLMYQQTSWEYVHFLWQANDGLSPFLGQEGVNLLDGWLNTGMSAPFEMAAVTVPIVAVPSGSVHGGVLTSPARSDLSGTTVAAWETTGSTLVGSSSTDLDGAFSLALPPDSYEIRASRASFLWAATSLSLADGEAVTLTDVTLLGGDIDGNDTVGVVDVSYVASRYGMVDAAADLDGSGTVGVVDVSATASNYGESAPLPWP